MAGFEREKRRYSAEDVASATKPVELRAPATETASVRETVQDTQCRTRFRDALGFGSFSRFRIYCNIHS